MVNRQMRNASVVVAMAWLAVATTTTRSEAHAGYARSNPPDGASIRTAPGRVEIWFTQELFRRANANRIEVTGPDGQPAHAGEAVIDEADRKHLSIALTPNLAPGKYSVEWASLSATDGDPAEGNFTFTFDPGAADVAGASGAATAATAAKAPAIANASPVATAGAGAEATGLPWWALAGAALIAIGGATGAWALLSNPAEDSAR
ncbi:MAG: copper resistance protein CopC [Chloroflexi bacterium]|nr:copper resistance protein CopC [Chloroflexota bacterium]